MKKLINIAIFILLLSTISFGQNQPANNKANLQLPIPQIGVSVGTSDKPQDIALTLQVLFLMTILSLAPSIVIMTTSFLRIIIVFHFLKSALGTQNMPPSQMLAGLALFITFFVMAPTWGKVFDDALTPYLDNKITIQEVIVALEGRSGLVDCTYKKSNETCDKIETCLLKNPMAVLQNRINSIFKQTTIAQLSGEVKN